MVLCLLLVMEECYINTIIVIRANVFTRIRLLLSDATHTHTQMLMMGFFSFPLHCITATVDRGVFCTEVDPQDILSLSL